MPFINVKGKKIYYHQNIDILTDRPTVLFIHGAGGIGNNWIHQLSGIKDYNLIAIDLPGHGRSEGPAADAIKNYREFIWLFLQALELGPLIIAGHSMGGAIVMDLALNYFDALEGLIIVDSGASLRVNPKMLEALSKGEHPVWNVKYCYSFKSNPKFFEQAAKNMKAVPTEIYLSDFRACDNFNIMDRLKNINIPALVICGEDDQMTPVKYSEYLSRELAQSTFVTIPDAGHMSMIEQPELVNRAIRNFLARCFRLFHPA